VAPDEESRRDVYSRLRNPHDLGDLRDPVDVSHPVDGDSGQIDPSVTRSDMGRDRNLIGARHNPGADRLDVERPAHLLGELAALRANRQ